MKLHFELWGARIFQYIARVTWILTISFVKIGDTLCKKDPQFFDILYAIPYTSSFLESICDEIGKFIKIPQK
jgi:hypothetical protein